jgi:hypothetical protein
MLADPEIVDLALAVSWEHDEDFVRLVEQAVQAKGMQSYVVRSFNMTETLDLVRKRKLSFRYFLDRASDEDPAFLPLVQWADRPRSDGERRAVVINAHHHLVAAADKATMHLEFIAHGLHTPYTIIISPYSHKKELELSISELANLGRPFVIKPANTTGGGIGVVTGAESLKDVILARQRHRNDKYLLQRFITPALLENRRAWFRVFYAFGRTFLCWWDDLTHTYDEVTEQEEQRFGLHEFHGIGTKIFEICQLEFFSSEIALSDDGTPIVVDYVNEICDMRLKSKHPDGVPDPVVGKIVNALSDFMVPSLGKDESVAAQ